MKSIPDSRSPTARAAAWSSRILTVSLEMVLPGIAGHWVDRQLGTVALFTLLGFALGCYVAMVQLIRMTKIIERNTVAEQQAIKQEPADTLTTHSPRESSSEDPSFPEIEFPTRKDP